jgi:exonuclease VII small subunit
MELARGLMEKLEQRDQTIEQLRKELNKLKQEKAHGEMAIHTKDVG